MAASYILKTNMANRKNYGGKRSTKNLSLVFHATSNDGDTDESNANWFKSYRGASAHAFVDDDSVTISVPADYTAYSVGGKKWSDCRRTGGGKMYGKLTNANTYSIEMCDTVKNGRYDFTQKTLENAAAYGRYIMSMYNIPIERVYRHFDVNGKHCPIQWFGNDTAWETFKRMLVTTDVSSNATLDLDYSLVFDADYYAAHHADLKAAYGMDKNNLLNHFINNGMKEARQAKAFFNVRKYAANYSDLQKAFGVDWKAYYIHYMQHGFKEGRKAI